MDRQDEVLSLVLFSGTNDKLNAAAVLAVGPRRWGRKVNVFLQYWALDAFRGRPSTQGPRGSPRGRRVGARARATA